MSALLLSVREAAQELGLGRDTTYSLVREGRLRTIRVGRRVLVPRVELAEFVSRESGGGEVVPMTSARSGDDETPGRSDAEVS